VTFLDTAGLRESKDEVERIGVARAVSRALAADLRVLLEVEGWQLPPELLGKIDIAVRAKSDLSGGDGVSGKTGAGIDQLLSRIHTILSDRMAVVGSMVSARQRSGMQRAAGDLNSARAVLDAAGELEIAAEHVRGALRALDSIIGRVDVEDVLGEIFSRFCIGK
jgi:tRNA modification GTPase